MRTSMTKMLSLITVMGIVIGMGLLASCQSNNSADLVVYGKIYTAEGNQIVEAFAVKDGKYVYVGDKAGAEAFVEEGKTEVVDYSGKGLVMPGCGNGHAHYTLGYAIQSVGTVIGYEDSPEKFLNYYANDKTDNCEDKTRDCFTLTADISLSNTNDREDQSEKCEAPE